MIKLYEESELKRLATSEIDRMKDDTVFIQISETKFERKKILNTIVITTPIYAK